LIPWLSSETLKIFLVGPKLRKACSKTNPLKLSALSHQLSASLLIADG